MTSTDVIPAEYRPSASLILAGKQASAAKEQFDYSLLLIKRTEQTSYALNHCVFPGGVFDPKADESADWLTYFQSCGVTKAQLELLSCSPGTVRPEFMSRGQHFTRDISLRLTALREAFEEVGLLLCRPPSSLRDLDTVQPAQVVLQPFDREYWQHRVHNDAHQFLELCRHLAVLPDLWALSEWSVWRSPALALRKFDTVYYFAALETCDVPLLAEPTEVASLHWLQPNVCWRQAEEGVIWLPFILLYEMARVLSMPRWQQLMQFARNRSVHGTTLVQPINYRCDDCLFIVLPRDELYLEVPLTRTESIVIKGTIDEINSKAKRYNRIMLFDFHRAVLACNARPLDGHLPLQSRVNKRLSKL